MTEIPVPYATAEATPSKGIMLHHSPGNGSGIGRIRPTDITGLEVAGTQVAPHHHSHLSGPSEKKLMASMVVADLAKGKETRAITENRRVQKRIAIIYSPAKWSEQNASSWCEAI